MLEFNYDFAYETRGGSTPQGKQRVWFSSHPKDFPLFFRAISRDILERHNCAIWYDNEYTVSEDLLLQRLKLMRLFVIPVTFRFLSQPSRARDVELRFAVEHHIPILPLIQEPGLDDLFRKTFGDLHFLNKLDCDRTAIRYEDKLTRFLSAVLFEDDLIHRIRCEFDTRIFLSYRKKDREDAQKLMKLIHSYDFCRDIAIWYDEFLIPGEEFNDAIRNALMESELFVMVVTQNLVKESNYVMTDEYPLTQAVDPPKPVLPVQMLDTDLDALTTKYPGIPPCVNGEDTVQLSDALLQIFQRRNIPLQQRISDPEHNFLMGLAYLGGIEVERDPERAVHLICSAAEAGMIEAMQKLVTMYRYGQIVSRSFETAIQWQEKIVTLLQRLFDNSAEHAYASDLIYALQDLGHLQAEQRNFFAARDAYYRALTLSTLLPCQRSTAELKCQISDSYNMLGELAYLSGQSSEAVQYFEQALNIQRDISAQWYDSTTDYSHIEPNEENAARLELAKQIFEFVQKMRFQIGNDSVPIEYRRKQMISYGNLGKIAADRKDWKKAYEYFHLSYIIASENLNERNTVSEKQDLCSVCSNIGFVLWAQGDVENAAIHYKQAVTLAKEAAAEDNSISAKRVWADSCMSIGYFAQKTNKLSSAEYFLRCALQSYLDIMKELPTPETAHALSDSFHHMGNQACLMKQFEDSCHYFQKELELLMCLYQAEPSTDYWKKRMLTVKDMLSKLAHYMQKPGLISRWEIFQLAQSSFEQPAKRSIWEKITDFFRCL